MAKSTNSSNLFAGFNPPKMEKKVEKVENVIEEPAKAKVTLKLSEDTIKVTDFVEEEIKETIKAQEYAVSSKKIGRPKKHTDDTKVISVRMDKDMYEFVRRNGKKEEFDGITDYVNHLIKKEMGEC